MNNILNHGFVAPYIKFYFSAGSIDTIPPRYFVSFHQERTVDKACNFTLNLLYAPGNFDEDTASIMHKLLLSSVKKPVTYQYGYITAGGGLTLQNQCYSGNFLTYTEDINDGYLTYTISGVARSVELTSPQVQVSDYIAFLKRVNYTKRRQPSKIVSALVTGRTYEAANTGIHNYFSDFDINIDHSDKEVDVSIINIEDGPLHDVFFGKVTANGTSIPSGLVNYSFTENSVKDVLNSGLLSDNIVSIMNRDSDMLIRNRYVSSGISSEEFDSWQAARNAVKNLQITPFICYFDNVIPSVGSPLKGSFNYVPKVNMQPTNIFNYDFGNSFLDSDVISFNVSYDATKAVAVIPSLKDISDDIDAGGEYICSNYNSMQSDDFFIQTYNTPSGFNEAAFISNTTLATALSFPFEASMTILGQIDCNKLLDTIRVNVFVNGLEHVGMSGDYRILGIEDDLSMDGFTTTFKMIKAADARDAEDLPEYENNYSETGSRAWHNQQALDNDYSVDYSN